MNTQTPTRLLLLNDSRDEADRLLSMLNNAGKQVDAQYIDSEEALAKVLQEHNWDLLIGHANTQNLAPDAALRTIRKLGKDIPVILLTEESGTSPIVEGLKRGVSDVLIVDEDQHLLQVMSRELKNREARSQSRMALRKLKEVERRSQQLLDSSKDAIAYVEDGMFLYVNESFAQMLGYPDKDDLECMPIIDTIADEDQAMLRDFLKDVSQKGNVLDTQVLAFKMLSASGEKQTINADISLANYDEESCIQLLVPSVGASQAGQALASTSSQSPSPKVATSASDGDLLALPTLLEKLDKALGIAIDKETTGAVIHIRLNNFINTVVEKVGANNCERVLKLAGKQITKLSQELQLTAAGCQFGGDGFLLVIPEVDAGQILKTAETLSQGLRDYYIEIEGSSLQFQYFVGVGLFGETTTSSDTPIQHALKACELASLDESKLAELFEPEQDESEATSRSDQEMVRLLDKALENNRFKLLYQPILSLRGSTQEHYEVLVRMYDSKNTEYCPEDYLAAANHAGLAAKVDRWVIAEALKTLAKHRAGGHDTRLVIKLSVQSLKDPKLVPWLEKAFSTTKLNSDYIIFQLAEEEVNDHIPNAKELSKKLTGLGSAVAISHFGCAVNPFNVLQHVQANYIKLDGSFTRMLQSPDEASKFNDMIKELHHHDKVTVVPYVENASVLSKLWQSGVHYIQGHYLQAPTEAMDYEFDSEG